MSMLSEQLRGHVGYAQAHGHTGMVANLIDAACELERLETINAALLERVDADALQASYAVLLREALVRADQFITNGIELGYITMPDDDCPDPAKETPGIIRAALAKNPGSHCGASAPSPIVGGVPLECHLPPGHITDHRDTSGTWFGTVTAPAECNPTLTECPRCKNDISKCDGTFAAKQLQSQGESEARPPRCPVCDGTVFPGADQMKTNDGRVWHMACRGYALSRSGNEPDPGEQPPSHRESQG